MSNSKVVYKISIFVVFAMMAFNVQIGRAVAEAALDDAVNYVMFGAGSLPVEMTDKYILPTESATIKCVYDDNEQNLNINALAPPNNLTFIKDTAVLYDDSDVTTVIGNIMAPAVPKSGLLPTANCGAR